MTYAESTYQRLAATAPQGEEEDTSAAAELQAQPELNELCEDWAAWCRTRRFYVRPSLPPSILGRLRSKSAGSRNGGPDAVTSAALLAFHLAVLGQPAEALDRKAFELHYFWSVRNVKAAAQELGISRQHWYRLVRDFRERAYRVSQEILALNLSQAEQLPSRSSHQPATV